MKRLQNDSTMATQKFARDLSRRVDNTESLHTLHP